MIVKVIKAGKAGSGRALASYVLDLKHEHKGERLGAYALDLKHGGEKVEWARTVNTGVDDPRWAVQAIELHNARNTRAHRISRYEHIVVSFAEGERPNREQMAVIEDRLMEAIGFGNHPRVSAVHRNTENLHLHIAASRIDPATLKAEHPRFNHFNLQAEAAKLEIELGLQQERKTLLPRERQEIEHLQEIHGLELNPPTPGAPAQRQARERQSLDQTIKARDAETFVSEKHGGGERQDAARAYWQRMIDAGKEARQGGSLDRF